REPHGALRRAHDGRARHGVRPQREEHAAAALALVALVALRGCVCLRGIAAVQPHTPLRSFATSSSKRSSANATLWRRTASRSPAKRRLSAGAASPTAQPNQTSPTGFSGVPPLGPAMPLTATAQSAPSRS